MRVLLLCLLIGLAGCTVAPRPVVSRTASFDGNAQNSGFLYYNEDGSGTITPHARDRFNALVDRYGKRFPVPVQRDDGITLGPVLNGVEHFVITAESLTKFRLMNRWKKEDRDG